MSPRESLRGRVVFRTAPDEAPGHVPSRRDAARGHAEPATRFDGGPIDAALRRHSTRAALTRAFHAARNLHAPGRAHLGWDHTEEEIGLSRTFCVDLDPDADVSAVADTLRALRHVEMATPDHLCEAPLDAPHTTALRDPFEQVGADEALAMEPGDPSIIVAVVDSGVALRHTELAGRLRAGVDTVDLSQDRVSRRIALLGDHLLRDREPDDDMGHGTACAGILVARGRLMHRGLAGRASLLPARALAAARAAGRAKLTAVGSLSDINAAVKTAVDLGARVLNLSFGTPASSLTRNDPVPHVEVARYAMARDCVLVAASGNSGDAVPFFPASLPGVIAVGAVDGFDEPAGFTSRGPHVALCAPGVAVRSTALDGYGAHTGTSFAAPFVTAACALMVARAHARATALPPFAVRTLLVQSARPFARRARREGYGAGILDVPAALRAVDAYCREGFDDERDIVSVPESARGAQHAGTAP